MATVGWYHASLKPIGRSAGRSAVACAAYRTGSRMIDERYAAIRDFSAKSDVVTSFTVAPDGSPSWATDAERLWNAVEAREVRKNSQVAFEWEVALPNELTHAEREAIAREFADWLVTEYRVAVTIGIHEGGTRGNGLNDHLHGMMTTREVGPEGWAKNKLRTFSTQPGMPNPEVDRVREHIADLINDALEEAGSEDRIDHGSFEAGGISKPPTKHLGRAASAMERKHHQSSDRADINRAIIEERLAWQREETFPDITPELDEEFSQRWEGWQPLKRGVDTDRVARLETGAPAATSEAHRGWRVFVDRVRAFRDRAAEFLHDETSGAPEAERGFTARLFDAGFKLWMGSSHHNAHELGEGVDDAAQLAVDMTASPPPVESGGHAKTFGERVRERAVDFWRNERGSVPDTFDRETQRWRTHSPAEDVPSSTGMPDAGTPDREGPDIV